MTRAIGDTKCFKGSVLLVCLLGVSTSPWKCQDKKSIAWHNNCMPMRCGRCSGCCANRAAAACDTGPNQQRTQCLGDGRVRRDNYQ